jgi:hypothetical protein
MAALPEAQATSVNQVGLGLSPRYSWTTPATDRCLPDHRGVDGLTIDGCVLERSPESLEGQFLDGGIGAPPEASVADADDSDSRHFHPPPSYQ